MDALIDFLAGYGYWGMLVVGFLAGSFIPFSSETVMITLWATGLDPLQLVLYGTVGNTLGSMLNYGIGCLGRLDWLEHWFHIKPENLKKAERFMAGRGALTGFFCFLPVLGSALSVALGLARANLLITCISVALGKFLRYWLLIFGLNRLF